MYFYKLYVENMKYNYILKLLYLYIIIIIKINKKLKN